MRLLNDSFLDRIIDESDRIMPMLNSFYAWLLALAAYGTVDFNDYTLLSTNDKGYSFYLDETDNYIIEETIDNHLRAYHPSMLGSITMDQDSFIIGILSAQGELIGGIAGAILSGSRNGVLSDKECYVDNIWVDEVYRNQGLGTLLMQQAQDYAQKCGCKLITMNNIAQADHANELFEKMGFEYFVIIPSPENLKGHAIYASMGKRLHATDRLINSKLPETFTQQGYQLYIGHPLHDVSWLSVFSEFSNFIKSRFVKIFWSDEAEKYANILNLKLKNDRASRGISEPINKFTIFITSPDKKIIGGVIGEVEVIEGFGNWLNIHDVAIDENYRKHALGRELFKQVDAYAQSKDCKYLELWTGEWQARGFYEKVGFMTIATFPRFLHAWNQEGYILRKQLE